MFKKILANCETVTSKPWKKTTHLVSGTIIPSSTHAILTVVAPISTTQALDIPAPYVAASDSWLACQASRTKENQRVPAEHTVA